MGRLHHDRASLRRRQRGYVGRRTQYVWYAGVVIEDKGRATKSEWWVSQVALATIESANSQRLKCYIRCHVASSTLTVISGIPLAYNFIPERFSRTKPPMAPAIDADAVWLVTGCSSGIGQSIAKYVHKAGQNIVATARNVDSLQYLPEGPKVCKLTVDVTSQASISAAINATIKRFGRLDVVVNNAGYSVVTEFEGVPEEVARKQIDTMFWGPVRMTRESLRVFREVNAPGQGGTIIQVSSIGGYAAYQGNAFYHASKFALEGFTKSIRKDLNPKWNINLMIISPGGVKTNFFDNINYLPRHPAYANDPEAPLNGLIAFMKDPATQDNLSDPDKCAAVIFDLVLGQKERPLPVRLNLGADSLPVIRNEVDGYIKEIEEWEAETLKVAPSTNITLIGFSDCVLHVLFDEVLVRYTKAVTFMEQQLGSCD
ncbi:putative oxidoreductase [Hyphodiscus hymeniophilus]|uniref:Oxidoreductase n=1 Tax=Hyphodiscus hymeniophilus TaxID=353542 RepID=A0A9P6VPP4_9HELO|nr:putative oxidoreductase [Hyphodiscus hymeniophilus]